MKKLPSLRPALARMQQRLTVAQALPVDQQADFYYYNSRKESDFCSELAAGNQSALTLALDLLAAELPLQEDCDTLYTHSIRAALRTACAAGRLSPAQQKIHYTIESRYLQRLVLRAYHSEPGTDRESALRRLPEQQELMQQLFGHTPTLHLEPADWPTVAAPVAQLQRAARRRLINLEQAEQLAHSSEHYLMELIHDPESMLPAHHLQQPSPAPTDTLCYFFSENHDGSADWRIAPWGDIEPLVGFALAADTTFYRLNDDWGNCHGNNSEVTPPPPRAERA